MKAQTKTVVSLAIVGALIIAAISGATYAWYSDAKQSDVHVESGEVKVGMNIGDLTLYSMGVERTGESKGTFENGGTATVDSTGVIKIEKATLGDAVRIPLELNSNSTINIKWKLSNTCDPSSFLYCKIIDGSTEFDKWSDVVEPGTKGGSKVLSNVVVEVGVKENATSWAGKSVKLEVKLDAVQANDPVANTTIKVDTADKLDSSRIRVDSVWL